MIGAGGEKYLKLRAWYLATLRKRISAADLATPGKLIAADRKAVEQLVLEDAGEERHQKLNFSPAEIALIALPALACLPSFFGLLQQGYVQAVTMAAVPALLCSVLCLLLCERRHANWQDVNKRLEQAVEGENAIADFAMDALLALDERLRIVAASPSVSELFGWKPFEMVDKNLAAYIRAATTEIKLEHEKAVQIQFAAKNDTVFDAELRSEWSASERLWFCTCKDVTARKKLERMRAQFVSMVGHDLRTPLTSLSCTMAALDNERLSEGASDLVNNAKTSISGLLKLVNELLHLQKLDAGKLPLQLSPCDLESIVANSIKFVDAYAKYRHITIAADTSSISVDADSDRLLQVVVNLLSNAIKFSPEDGTIKIQQSICDQRVRIAIADEGPGVPPEEQALIFESFEQGNEGRRREGSGLGLAIARMIIEAHGGQIGVISDGKNGAVFWFAIPMSQTSI